MLDSGPSSAFHHLADPGHSFLALEIELDPSNPSGSQVIRLGMEVHLEGWGDLCHLYPQ